jgi:hypothetical protein
MGPLDQIIHAFNFVAPAWGVALFCVFFTRFAAQRWLPVASAGLWTQVWVLALLGSATLIGGVVFWGVDGKMATYSVLVAVCAFTQWLFCRGWQR